MVLARHGVVCASQPLAAVAGLTLLRNGGNAFDAAVGTAAVLNVVEPMSTGIGGDMFALAWPAGEGKLVGLNGSGRSAATADGAHLRKKGFKAVPTYGAYSVTVPGAFHGWATLLSKYGKLPLEVVLADAIRYAEEGFPVSEVIASDWNGALRHRDVPEFAATYLIREGDSYRAPRTGENFRQPELARTLRALAKGGIEEFHRGDLARKIADFLELQGSWIRYDDLARHESTWVEPVSTRFGAYDVHELPPNGQGIVALQMLNILEGYDLESLGHNSADYLHLIAEAKKLAFADRDRYVADADANPLPVSELISKAYADRRRALIDRSRASQTVGAGDPTETVYLTVVDKDRNAISLIESIFGGFGSKVVPADLGFALQNRGTGFSLEPGHLNSLEPHKRSLHTNMPGFVTKDGQPWLSFGVMGGDMQPQGHTQVLSNIIDFGMNLQEAGDAARVRHGGGSVLVEPGVTDAVITALERMGHRVRRTGGGSMGGYQAIMIHPDTGMLHAGTDPRKDGAAIGY